MKKKCDKCQENDAKVAYTETVNGRTKHLHLCENCANEIIGEKEQFLNSFFGLDPFRKVDLMFDSMFEPKLAKPKTPAKPQINEREEKLKDLKVKVDELKQEEGIAVMLQDYLKAAEIKNKREKLQKEAEQIAFGNQSN